MGLSVPVYVELPCLVIALALSGLLRQLDIWLILCADPKPITVHNSKPRPVLKKCFCIGKSHPLDAHFESPIAPLPQLIEFQPPKA